MCFQVQAGQLSNVRLKEIHLHCTVPCEWASPRQLLEPLRRICGLPRRQQLLLAPGEVCAEHLHIEAINLLLFRCRTTGSQAISAARYSYSVIYVVSQTLRVVSYKAAGHLFQPSGYKSGDTR